MVLFFWINLCSFCTRDLRPIYIALLPSHFTFYLSQWWTHRSILNLLQWKLLYMSPLDPCENFCDPTPRSWTAGTSLGMWQVICEPQSAYDSDPSTLAFLTAGRWCPVATLSLAEVPGSGSQTFLSIKVTRGGLLKRLWDPNPRVSHLEALRWSLKMCISNKQVQQLRLALGPAFESLCCRRGSGGEECLRHQGGGCTYRWWPLSADWRQ